MVLASGWVSDRNRRKDSYLVYTLRYTAHSRLSGSPGNGGETVFFLSAKGELPLLQQAGPNRRRLTRNA